MDSELAGLLPCPFCGGTPRIGCTSSFDERCGYNFKAFVSCACGGSITLSSLKDSGGWCIELQEDAKWRAATAWNKRAIAESGK